VAGIIHLVGYPALRARSSVAERPAHNRLVVGSNPAEPTSDHLVSEEFTIREILEALLGAERKRKLPLRHKSNDNLFALDESQLLLPEF
jgi:hypothetical protein